MKLINSLVTLTETQTKVLEHLLLGKSTQQTASEMGLSKRTVETHRDKIFKGMKVHCAAEAADFALKHRMIEPQNLIPHYIGGKPFTADQRQIFLLISQGKTQKMIASELNISVKKANDRSAAIAKKLGLKGTKVHLGVALTHLAYLTELLQPDPATDDPPQSP